MTQDEGTSEVSGSIKQRTVLHYLTCGIKKLLQYTATMVRVSLIILLLTKAFKDTSSLSPLAGTQWKLNLDVGLQPGSWMPKRYPGWAESGARLGLDIEVEFTSKKSKIGESLVGPKRDTYELAVTSPQGSCSFVSERGQETVEFTMGGWCVQRPTDNIRNAGGSLVKPAGLLRFWLDCPSGATRRDVVIMEGTRIYFTTGVWDDEDPNSVQSQDEEYRKVLADIQELTDSTKEIRKESESTSVFQNIMSFRNLVDNSKDFDRLKALKEKYERELPPVGASVAPNGVQMAPTGSLVIKGNATPDWLPGSEYLILGTFQTRATAE